MLGGEIVLPIEDKPYGGRAFHAAIRKGISGPSAATIHGRNRREGAGRVTANDLQRIALSLAGTSKTPHFDRAAFKVNRIYVTLAADGVSANSSSLPKSRSSSACWRLAPSSPLPGDGGGKAGPPCLSELSLQELRQALEMAWRHAAPKALKG